MNALRPMRDTDADWRLIAETDPYFGVLTEPRYQIGRIDASALDAFYADGRADVDFVLTRIRAGVPDFRPIRALDLGCGTGRLALAMAAHAQDVVGLDIAPAMLAKAREAAAARGVRNVEFVGGLEAEHSFDWINSYIVFQHIPPERGYVILEDMVQRLVVGGVLSLQVTVFRDQNVSAHVLRGGRFWSYDGGAARLMASDDRDPPGTITMFDYDLNRVLAIMASHQVQPFGIAPTDHDGCHGVWLFARRNIDEAAIRAGTIYGPQTTPSFSRFLRQGWSFVENWGVWSEERSASLLLRVDPGLRASHALVLWGRAFLFPGIHEKLTIRARVNGQPVAEQVLTTQTREGRIILPLEPVDHNGAMQITLTIDHPRSPRECGLGGDTRALGFGLERISLEDLRQITG